MSSMLGEVNEWYKAGLLDNPVLSSDYVEQTLADVLRVIRLRLMEQDKNERTD